MQLAADGEDVPLRRWTKRELARAVMDRVVVLLQDHAPGVGPAR
jgi:hypothetical protein